MILARLYHWLNLLSIDVAFGAVFMQFAVATYLNLELPITVPLALFLAVWLIYTIDHLWDAKHMLALPHSTRHQWHQRHFIVMLWIVSIVSLVGLVVVTQLPANTITWGLVMLVLTGGYFLAVHVMHLSIPKELVVALCYTLGIALGPLSLYQEELDFGLWVLLTKIVVLATLNLLLFTLYEQESDAKDNQPNAVIQFGLKAINRWVQALWILFWLLMIMAYGLRLESATLLFLFALMGTLLGLLYWKPQWFRYHQLYRLIGDGIFLMPGLMLLMP